MPASGAGGRPGECHGPGTVPLAQPPPPVGVGKAEAGREAAPVLGHRHRIVADVVTEVQCAVRRRRDAAVPVGEDDPDGPDPGHGDARRIARVARRVFEEAQQLRGVKLTAEEVALGLKETELTERAIVRLAKRAAEPGAQFEKTTKVLSTQKFFDEYAGAGYYVVDRAFTGGDHGAVTHIFQDLVLDDAFAEGRMPMRGRDFRMRLRFVPDLPDPAGGSKLYRSLTLDKETQTVPYIRLGNALFEHIFDSTSKTIIQPEILWPLLRDAIANALK